MADGSLRDLSVGAGQSSGNQYLIAGFSFLMSVRLCGWGCVAVGTPGIGTSGGVWGTEIVCLQLCILFL